MSRVAAPKVWLTLLNLAPRYYGDSSFSNGFDAQRYFELSALIQSHRTTPEKKNEYREQRKVLTPLSLEVLQVFQEFKYISDTPLNIVFWQKKPVDEEMIYISQKYIYVREDFAEILMQFNLGSTRLFNVGRPIGINGAEIYDRDMYLLNISEWRNFFIPEKSELVFNSEYCNQEGYPQYALGEDCFVKAKVVLNDAVLDCDVDIWHDPMLKKSIFFSDRLQKALDEKGLLARTKHKKCSVVKLGDK